MPNFSKSGGSRLLTSFPLDFELAVDLDSSAGQAFHARIMLIHLKFKFTLFAIFGGQLQHTDWADASQTTLQNMQMRTGPYGS